MIFIKKHIVIKLILISIISLYSIDTVFAAVKLPRASYKNSITKSKPKVRTIYNKNSETYRDKEYFDKLCKDRIKIQKEIENKK